MSGRDGIRVLSLKAPRVVRVFHPDHPFRWNALADAIRVVIHGS